MKSSSIAQHLARQWWNAERFGLTPGKLRFRLLSTGMPKIVCVSIPKAGTHLIERALCKIPGVYRPLYKTIDEVNLAHNEFDRIIKGLRPGQVIFSHLFYTPERARLLKENGVACILMVRDLRDIVISEANYLSSTPAHIYHRAFVGLESQKEKILRSLEGSAKHGLPSMAELFQGFSGWLESDAMVIRFEDIIGPDGGGDVKRQFETLSSLFEAIGINCSHDCVTKISTTVFSNESPTFNKGHVAQWRRLFDEEIKLRFKELTGDAIIQYGYEKTKAW